MKMIHCDLCGNDVPLTKELQNCKCLNIGGMYQDNGVYADIFLKDEKSFHNSRVIGVSNSVMMGYNKRDIAHIGEWNDHQLRIFVNGEEKKYEDVKFPIIPWDEEPEILAKLMEMNGYEPDDIEFVNEDKERFFYRMKDGARILLYHERKDVKEPLALLIKIEDGCLIETKICKFIMR